MIDGISILIPAVYEEGLLEKLGPVTPITIMENVGPHNYSGWEAKWNGLTFKKWKSGIHAHGSIHRFWNSGGTNIDAFSFQDCVKAIGNLCDYLEVPPYDCRLRKLELGVNLVLQYPIAFLLENVMLHRTSISKGGSDWLAFEHSQYWLKVYNKSSLVNVHRKGEVLRVEVAFKKMEIPRRMGIKSLESLFEPSLIRALGDYLLKKLDELVVFDWTIDEIDLSTRGHTSYNRYSNPNYWRRLVRESYPKKLQRARKGNLELSERHGSNVHKALVCLARDTMEELLSISDHLYTSVNSRTIKEQTAAGRTNQVQLELPLTG